MSALLAGLSSTVVSRLQVTWALVSRRSSFEDLLQFNDPTGGFSAYRALSQSVEGPCVPFIGMFLTDIVHNEDKIPDNILSPLNPEVRLIFFSKKQRLYEIASVMLRHQTKAYSFTENVPVRSFLERQVEAASSIDDDWFWAKSRELRRSEKSQGDDRG